MTVFFDPHAGGGSGRSWLDLFLLLLATTTVRAAFTHDALFHLDWIRKHNAGSYCFHPGTLPGRSGFCSDVTLDALLDVHTSLDHGPGLSIAYYSLPDLTVLGGAGWSGWNTTSGPVGLCLSGVIEGIPDAYVTKCRFATRDNDQEDPFSHSRECALDVPQKRVVDGCYVPPTMPTGFQLSSSTNSILTCSSALDCGLSEDDALTDVGVVKLAHTSSIKRAHID
ncbi:hypothetical protein BKA62DRAFT_769549 [Auriculariales sp. MPI-PUGE-AT-0066]|nr:hypothetical protein BKA62DRAFT_769549 [Auriculariales sp. MPI-PUGE-AT-0066]